MTKPRTRDPDEPRVARNGKYYNSRTHKPLKYATAEEANAAKAANLNSGPSDKMLAIVASGVVLPPRQIAAVRQAIVNVVEKNIERAGLVLAGDEKWSQPQVSLFLGLLHKVAPTMSESLHRHAMQPVGKDYTKLSRVELEAALAEVMNEPKVIDVPAEEVEAKKRKRKPWTEEDTARKNRTNREARLSVKATAARILEQPETVLPPLTRAEDDENRRRAARSAKGLRTRARTAAILNDLDLMAQSDGLRVAEKFLKTPPPDPE